MNFDIFLDHAWADHATQPAAVAARLAEGVALAQTDEQVAQLAFLAQHVHGQHLGRWAEGLALQQQLAALPQLLPGGSTAQALQRHATVLQLAGGLATLPADTPAAERARFEALTAAALALFDSPRASVLLQLAETTCATLPDTDAAVRALATSANNIAAALHDEATLSPEQQALMLQAAAVARRAWGRAGTWLEVERADYRLALCHARAGDTTTARLHAAACLTLVQAQGQQAQRQPNGPAKEPAAPALEHFFGWEALARVEAAAGQADARAAAVAQAATWFAQLTEADQAWCKPALQALQAPQAAA